MGVSGEGRDVGLAELVAALSLGIDLGFGQPMEHVVRQTRIALRVAERLGLEADQRAVDPTCAGIPVCAICVDSSPSLSARVCLHPS